MFVPRESFVRSTSSLTNCPIANYSSSQLEQRFLLLERVRAKNNNRSEAIINTRSDSCISAIQSNRSRIRPKDKKQFSLTMITSAEESAELPLLCSCIISFSHNTLQSRG
jgi:hypothetical protein